MHFTSEQYFKGTVSNIYFLGEVRVKSLNILTTITITEWLFSNMGFPVPLLCSLQKTNVLVGLTILSNQERELHQEQSARRPCGDVGRREGTTNSENRQEVSQEANQIMKSLIVPLCQCEGKGNGLVYSIKIVLFIHLFYFMYSFILILPIRITIDINTLLLLLILTH